MYNNLNFLNSPANRAQLLIHLTLWTFSVGSISRAGMVVIWRLRYLSAKDNNLICVRKDRSNSLNFQIFRQLFLSGSQSPDSLILLLHILVGF